MQLLQRIVLIKTHNAYNAVFVWKRKRSKSCRVRLHFEENGQNIEIFILRSVLRTKIIHMNFEYGPVNPSPASPFHHCTFVELKNPFLSSICKVSFLFSALKEFEDVKEKSKEYYGKVSYPLRLDLVSIPNLRGRIPLHFTL